MNPLFGNLTELTEKNKDYRHVYHTEKNFQIILQSLKKDEDVPEEEHKDSVQFLFCVKGTGIVRIEDVIHIIKKDIFFIIPSGKRHYIKSTSEEFKFYTIYNSIEHDPNSIEKRQTKRYLIKNDFILSKNNNSETWSLLKKKDETKFCNHEFKNIKQVASEISKNDKIICPLCHIK